MCVSERERQRETETESETKEGGVGGGGSERAGQSRPEWIQACYINPKAAEAAKPPGNMEIQPVRMEI